MGVGKCREISRLAEDKSRNLHADTVAFMQLARFRKFLVFVSYCFIWILLAVQTWHTACNNPVNAAASRFTYCRLLIKQELLV